MTRRRTFAVLIAAAAALLSVGLPVCPAALSPQSVWANTASTVPADSLENDADAAWEKKNYASARELYVQARERTPFAERPENWKRITRQIVRCQTALGNAEHAAEEYFLLCRVDPMTSLDAIPLPWFTPLELKAGSRPREKTAEDILDPLQTKSRGPGATLLAACILSTGPTPAKRARGMQILRELASWTESETTENAKSPDVVLRRRTAQLAAAFLWKQRIPTLRRATDLIPLERQLERIPEPLRAGPTFLYASAAAAVGERETAVLSWMRLPILYPEQRVLVVESLREASRTLEKSGRRDQAENLRLEAERTALAPDTR